MGVQQKIVKNILDSIKPVQLVAATKYVGIEEINELESLGCMVYGENRVQDFLKKYEQYQGKGKWHFIGTLQPNKVKYIIDKVELIHSVNKISLIKEIEKQACKINKSVHILLEINIANEESKQGFAKDELNQVMNYLQSCPHIIVDGLMMMAPHIKKEKTRIYFKNTRLLLEQLKSKYPMYPWNELSMGMSNDYDIAIEEGATMVRIGSMLFDI